MKKILCVLLCLILVLSMLVSCGTKKGNDNKETEPSKNNAPETELTTEPEDDESEPEDVDETEDEDEETEEEDTESNTEESEPEDTETEPGEIETEDEDEETETQKKPVETETRKELTTEDFTQGGVARDFNMMVRVGRYAYLFTEKDSADQLTHGVYVRNTRIENDYGIKFKIYEPQAPEGANNSQPAGFVNALAGSTGEYDLCVPDYWWLLEHQGFFLNLFDRDELGFNQGALKQDYWYMTWNSNTTINNKLYTVVGDAALEVLENIEVVYYNKTMTDYYNGGTNMYELVDNHEWTLDMMNTIGKEFAMGYNTPEDTGDDIYGVMYDDHSGAAQMYAAGIKLTEINEQGGISLVAKSRGLNSLIHAKIKEVIQDPANKYNSSTARSDLGNKTNWFVNGQAVFYSNCLYVGSNITKNAADDFEFGILPQPLYQEGDDYISTAYGVSVFGIPKSSVDPHFSAVILDALNYHSWNTVVSAFFDATMKAQLASGSEDARMLDLARENLYFDFAWILQAGGRMTVHNAFYSTVKAQDKELASALDSAMEVSVPGLGEIMEFYNQD